MPIYLLECSKCENQWDAYFQMSAKKEGPCPKCKTMGKRVFTKPNMGIDTKINPNDLDALTKKTGNMKGTIGNLWDLAAEASEKRGGENDPIRKKALEDYAKTRKGIKYRPKQQSVDVEIKLGDTTIGKTKLSK